MQYLIPNRVYDILKWTCIIALPALGWAYGELAPDWGWPNSAQICHTIDVIGTVLGMLIGISHLTAKPSAVAIDPDATADLGRRVPEV